MKLRKLNNRDLRWAIRRLPKHATQALKETPGLVCAGGFIRAIVASEEVNDVDLFAPSKEIAELVARRMIEQGGRLVATDNAFTVLGRGLPVQCIHRWVFDTPEAAIESFDFTIARAGVWFNSTTKAFEGLCDERFYEDLAAKRLIYCAPTRAEDAGGSMLRVLKFYQRGYRIPMDSLGAVMARMVVAIDTRKVHINDEIAVSRVLCGLLREVDPNVDPQHESHLPSEDEVDAEIATAPQAGAEGGAA